MWITSGLDQNDLYRTIQYVESSLDHVPDKSSRHLFANDSIIKYDLESKEFFKFHQKDIEKFCDDFFQYIETKEGNKFPMK
jgi:phage pi2 protein 07